jgi:hypothetical protein
MHTEQRLLFPLGLLVGLLASPSSWQAAEQDRQGPNQAFVDAMPT